MFFAIRSLVEWSNTMIENVVYVQYQPIPTSAANAVHAMKVCQAIQREGYQATLCAPLAPESDVSPGALWHRYGISTPFNVKLFRPIPGLRRYDVALRSALYIRQLPNVVVFSLNHLASVFTGRLGLRTIVDVHDRPPSGMGAQHLAWAFRQPGFRRVSVITIPMREVYHQSYKDVLTEDMFVIAPNGFDTEQFSSLPEQAEVRQQLDIPAEQFVAGYVGHLYPGRGIDVLLALAQRMPDVLFLIVGGRPKDVDYWRAEAANMQLQNVRFEGYVPNAKLPEYMATANCLLMPYQHKIMTADGTSDTAKVASPMKMFEYMATRRVILSGDIPVFREVLNDDNAVLLDPEDIDLWQSALQRVMDEPGWAQTLADQAYEDVQQYTWRARVRKLLEGLEE
jgi:glycosyltransferase involved in cell wall biosynthesis